MSVYMKQTSSSVKNIVPNMSFSSWKTRTINSGDFKNSGDRFLGYYHFGPLCVVSFYLTSSKAFSTWYDGLVSNDIFPAPALIDSSIDSIYLGQCWVQNKYNASPLIQITNMGVLKLRSMNASFSSGESFRGTFSYITNDTIL